MRHPLRSPCIADSQTNDDQNKLHNKLEIAKRAAFQVKMGGGKDGGTSSPEPDHDQSAPQDEVSKPLLVFVLHELT